jgi:hypothetical protein
LLKVVAGAGKIVGQKTAVSDIKIRGVGNDRALQRPLVRFQEMIGGKIRKGDVEGADKFVGVGDLTGGADKLGMVLIVEGGFGGHQEHLERRGKGYQKFLLPLLGQGLFGVCKPLF